MKKETLFVEVKVGTKINLYEFTRSLTGMLDYVGPVAQGSDSVDLASYQRIEASNYYSTSWYTFLPRELQAEISVLLPADIENFDTQHYSFLTHIGAVLLAVEQGDSLLVAELLHRRPYVFKDFIPLMAYILKPIAAESLFAWVYGRLNGSDGFFNAYRNDLPIESGEGDVGAILFGAARETLKPDPARESPEDMFIRYFRERSRHEKFCLTIGIVGANNHKWIDGFETLDNAVNRSAEFNFVSDPTATANRKQQFIDSLAVNVQAEPYNPHDRNAIAVTIDDIDAKLKGLGGKSKVGYIRATGAAILRKAFPSRFNYPAKLWRIGGDPGWFENAIVLKVSIN